MTRVVVLAVVLLSAPAAAGDRTLADKLFEKGRALQAQKDWAGAVEAFEASLREEPAPGTLYNLGICHQELGKLASAYTEFNDVVAKDSNKARVADAKMRAKALEPRLTKFKLTIKEPVRGLVVERDGSDITGLEGQVVPVDPKEYTISATAPGYKLYSTRIALDKEGETIAIEIPALEKTAEDPMPLPTTPTQRPSVVAGMFPRQLALRQLAIPDGHFEVSAGTAVSSSDTLFQQTPIDAAVGGRVGIQMFELGVSAGFHVRHSQMNKANQPQRWGSVRGFVGYSIEPEFAGRLEYTRYHPVGDTIQGSDILASLARKILLSQRIAIVAGGGFLYADRGTGDNSVSELTGVATLAVQATATPTLSFEAGATVGLNLSGELYNYTTSLGFEPAALYSASNDIDIFARVFLGLLPASGGGSSNDLRRLTIGLNWRH